MNRKLLLLFINTSPEHGAWNNFLCSCNYGTQYSKQFYDSDYRTVRGWSGAAMVLGKLPVPGRPTILITVGQGPIALAVGAGGSGLDIFTLIYPFPSLSLSLGDGPI